MKRFLYQILVFSLIVIIGFGWVLSRADGYTDPFYIRFTTPKQSSLILGSSRAAQGLVPAVFNEQLDHDFFNYSFTIDHSPFGPVYLESIKKKLDSNERDGIFIITIEPWSICSITNDPTDSLNFRERNLCLGNTSEVNMNPNFFYLIKNLKGSYYTIVRSYDESMYLHKDGWLEVSVPMNLVTVNKRIAEKTVSYRDTNLPKYKFSELRLTYLKKTVEYLNQHGKVYLVRLPIHQEIFEIENELMPNLKDKLNEVIPLTYGYYDMTSKNSDYQYTDGNHLYKESAKVVSMEIANWIKRNQQATAREES